MIKINYIKQLYLYGCPVSPLIVWHFNTMLYISININHPPEMVKIRMPSGLYFETKYKFPKLGYYYSDQN